MYHLSTDNVVTKKTLTDNVSPQNGYCINRYILSIRILGVGWAISSVLVGILIFETDLFCRTCSVDFTLKVLDVNYQKFNNYRFLINYFNPYVVYTVPHQPLWVSTIFIYLSTIHTASYVCSPINHTGLSYLHFIYSSTTHTLLHTRVAPSTMQVSPIFIYLSTTHTLFHTCVAPIDHTGLSYLHSFINHTHCFIRV